MKYYEVCTREGHTNRAKLVYGDNPAQAMKTAQASGLMGEVSCVNELMLCSVWIPPERMERMGDEGWELIGTRADQLCVRSLSWLDIAQLAAEEK